MAEGLKRELQSLMDQVQGQLDSANFFMRRDNTRRNELAVEAARDHRDRCEKLIDIFERSLDARKVKEELRACRDHAETWEKNFTDYARSDDPNENHNTFLYAGQIVRNMGMGYRNCLQSLDRMDLAIKTSDAPAASSLTLLVGTDGGGQVGWYQEEVRYSEGYDSSVDLDTTLSSSVIAKASAGGSLFGAHVSAEVGAESGSKVRSANTYKMSKCSTRSSKIFIDLSKPSYVYQLQTKVKLSTGHDVTLYGGVFFSHKLIT